MKLSQLVAMMTLALAASLGTAMAQDAAAGQNPSQIGEGAKNAVGPVLNGMVGRPA
jgi:cytochrome c